MKNAEKKELARSLYTKSQLNRKQIAVQVGTTEKTLRKWIDEENWDAIKDSLQITRPQLLQESYQQLAAINKKIKEELGGVPNKELSDAKGVIRKEIEAFSVQPLYKYIEVFEEFIDFLSKNEPSLINPFTDASQNFINQISKSK